MKLKVIGAQKRRALVNILERLSENYEKAAADMVKGVPLTHALYRYGLCEYSCVSIERAMRYTSFTQKYVKSLWDKGARPTFDIDISRLIDQVHPHLSSSMDAFHPGETHIERLSRAEQVKAVNHRALWLGLVATLIDTGEIEVMDACRIADYYSTHPSYVSLTFGARWV